MPGRKTKYEEMASKAAERIDRAKALGAQMTFLPDESAGAVPAAGRGKGKALSQMREFLANRGYRMPEDQLAEMAGLASGEGPMLTAMAQAEQVLAWAGDGAVQIRYTQKDGHRILLDPITGEPLPWQPTPEDKLEVFKQLYTVMLRAAEALLPYGMPKVGADQAPQRPVQILVQGGEAREVPVPQTARASSSHRTAPPPMPNETQQNQDVTDAEISQSDSDSRTDGPSD